MAAVVVRHELLDAAGEPVAGRAVTARLVAPADWLADNSGSIITAARAMSGDDGLVELKLTPQSQIAATDTYYEIRPEKTTTVWYGVVPDAGPVQLATILVDPDTLDPVGPDLPSFYLARGELGAPSGVAPLGADGKVPSANLPAGSGELDADLVAIAGLTPAANDLLQFVAGAWANRTPAQVKTSLGLVKADIGLSNVDNTADVDKPISTATQTALNGKISLSLVDAAGDLLVGSGVDTIARLAKGSEGQVLSVAAGAVGWVTPANAGLQVDPAAARYGCLALTMHPHDISWKSPQYIALASGRHYMYWLPLPAGTLVSGVRLPVQTAGAGAGELRFGVYNDDNSALGDTGDVAAQFTGAVGQTWQNVDLVTPAESTGDGVWITVLSTLDTGIAAVFANTDGVDPMPEWLLNPSSHRTALYRNGVATLPATLTPGTATAYIDFAIGVY